MSSALSVKTAPKVAKATRAAKIQKTTRTGGSTIRYTGGR